MGLKFIISVILCMFYVSNFSQKNRFEHLFKEIDTLKNEEQFEKLISLDSNNKLNDVEKINFYQLIISNSILIQKYDIALKYSFEAEKFAKNIKNDSLLAFYIKQIGTTYYHINKKEIALNYFLKAEKISHKIKSWNLNAMLLNNIGAIYVERNKYKEAKNALLKSIDIFNVHVKDKAKSLLPKRLLATLYTKMNQFELAQSMYIDLISLSKEFKDTTTLCFSLIYYSDLLVKTGNFKKAISYCQEAVYFARINKNKNTLANCVMTLANTYMQDHQYKEAAKYFTEVIYINKSIFQENLEKGISENEVKYKTEEIKRLKELAESKTLVEKQKNNFILVLFLSILFLLIISFLIIYLQQQNKRRKIEILLQKQLIESVIFAQEEEKTRIARDLHDGICQKFAATKLKFSYINSNLIANLTDTIPSRKDEIIEKFTLAISLLDEATNELRGISHEIMPPSLLQRDVISALKQLSINSFSDQIEYSFEVFGKSFELSENEEINIYRIAQEIFANILKHANATEVSVQILFTETTFNLIIEDNGIGFKSTKKIGIGLKNIKLRAEIIKAKFEIEPGINFGTISSLKINKKV
jgi:two-component system NarL family sensor kinase